MDDALTRCCAAHPGFRWQAAGTTPEGSAPAFHEVPSELPRGNSTGEFAQAQCTTPLAAREESRAPARDGVPLKIPASFPPVEPARAGGSAEKREEGLPWFSSTWLTLASRFFPLAGCSVGSGTEVPAPGLGCSPMRRDVDFEVVPTGFDCKAPRETQWEAVPGPGLDCKRPSPEKEWEARVKVEDALWDAQLKRGGSIGRIVQYEAHEQPCADIILRGGSGSRIRVQAVCQTGKAASAGVKSGDVLVSVNGDKEFASLSLEDFYQSLPKPAVLVFIGLVNNTFIAELRIKRKEVPLGLPSRLLQFPAADGPQEQPQVADEVIFEMAMAPD